MSPDTPLFGRLTIGNNRLSLGRGGFSLLMTRASEQLQKHRVGDDVVIQIECSRNKLQESSTFDKLQVVEQQLAGQILTNPKVESPFPGITVGRVAEVMVSPEYLAYEAICEPSNRIGLTEVDINEIRIAYHTIARDCFPHFPKWIQ